MGTCVRRDSSVTNLDGSRKAQSGRSPSFTQSRARHNVRFFLGTCYCRISRVKNFRIQYLYLAVASIDNPLPRANRYLFELCRKIKTELTTSHNIPFQPIWIWVSKIHSLQSRLIVKSLNSLCFASIKCHHLLSINGYLPPPFACVQRRSSLGRYRLPSHIVPFAARPLARVSS
jgi:hypothetical protein